MTPRTRALAALPAAALTAALLAGCGSHGSSAGSSGAPGTSAAPAPVSSSDLARMQKLVDQADSAAARADSDAASDK